MRGGTRRDSRTVGRPKARGARRILRIRRGRPQDVKVLVEHRLRMWADIGNRSPAAIARHGPVYKRWVVPRLRSGEVVAFLAEVDHTVVGSGCVWFQPAQPRPGEAQSTSPYILSMYTEAGHRGQGVASRLIDRLVRICREGGFGRVTLHASVQGRPVYRRLGFERTWEMRRWLVRPPTHRSRT